MNASINFEEFALELDARERPVEAAWAYEIAIQSTKAQIDLFLNLVVLYFQCADYGYQSHHHLRDDFVDGCWTRSFQVLDMAERLFGEQTEIQFWRAYISSVYTKEEGIEDFSRKLVERSDSLLPPAYLFLAGNIEYRDAAQELCRSVKDGLTERQRYIKSVIEAALTRHDASCPS